MLIFFLLLTEVADKSILKSKATVVREFGLTHKWVIKVWIKDQEVTLQVISGDMRPAAIQEAAIP